MKIILLSIVLSVNIIAQIDSTQWIPLRVGNYWEYYDPAVQKGVTIIGDTTINDLHYYIFQTVDFSDPIHKSITYRRLENNTFLYELYGNEEILYYDFSVDDGSSWEIDSSIFRACIKTDTVNLDMFQSSFKRKEFENQYFVDSVRMYFEREWQQVTRGVGETLFGYWGGYIELVGAIINGEQYGTITSLNETNTVHQKFKLNQNYPNPFNPSTTIEFYLPNREFVELNIYNMLGQKVKVLLENEISSGHHNITFSGIDIPSGVYLYQLKTSSFNQARKMLLLK